MIATPRFHDHSGTYASLITKLQMRIDQNLCICWYCWTCNSSKYRLVQNFRCCDACGMKLSKLPHEELEELKIFNAKLLSSFQFGGKKYVVSTDRKVLQSDDFCEEITSETNWSMETNSMRIYKLNKYHNPLCWQDVNNSIKKDKLIEYELNANLLEQYYLCTDGTLYSATDIKNQFTRQIENILNRDTTDMDGKYRKTFEKEYK